MKILNKILKLFAIMLFSILREIIFYVIPVLFSVAGILFFRKRGVKNV